MEREEPDGIYVCFEHDLRKTHTLAMEGIFESQYMQYRLWCRLVVDGKARPNSLLCVIFICAGLWYTPGSPRKHEDGGFDLSRQK